MLIDKKELKKELDCFIDSGIVGLSKRQKKELLILEIALAKIFKIMIEQLPDEV